MVLHRASRARHLEANIVTPHLHREQLAGKCGLERVADDGDGHGQAEHAHDAENRHGVLAEARDGHDVAVAHRGHGDDDQVHRIGHAVDLLARLDEEDRRGKDLYYIICAIC